MDYTKLKAVVEAEGSYKVEPEIKPVDMDEFVDSAYRRVSFVSDYVVECVKNYYRGEVKIVKSGRYTEWAFTKYPERSEKIANVRLYRRRTLFSSQFSLSGEIRDAVIGINSVLGTEIKYPYISREERYLGGHDEEFERYDYYNFFSKGQMKNFFDQLNQRFADKDINIYYGDFCDKPNTFRFRASLGDLEDCDLPNRAYL